MNSRHLKVTLALLSLLLQGCTAGLYQNYEDQALGAFARGYQARAGDAMAPSSSRQDELTELATPPHPKSALEAEDPLNQRIVHLNELGITLPSLSLQHSELLLSDDWIPSELDHERARAAFLLRNSGIAAFLKRDQASDESYSQIDALNDLVRQYEAFTRGSSTGATTPILMPRVQSWPLGNVDRLERALADLDTRLSAARTQQQLYSELLRFEASYQDALYWQSAAVSYHRTLRLARGSRDVAASRYEAGSGGYLDLLLASERVDKVRVQQRSAQEKALASRAELAALLNLPVDSLEGSELALSPSPTLPAKEELAERVLEDSPVYAQIALAAERSSLMVELVETQIQPELSLETYLSATGEVPSSKGQLAYIGRAPYLIELKLQAEASQSALAAAEFEVPAQAKQRWAQLFDALKQLELFQGASAKRARQAREFATDAYKSGEITFFELDATITQELELALSRHRLQRSAAIAALELEALLGGAL